MALPIGVTAAQEPPPAPAAEPLPDEVPGARLEGIAPGASHSGHVRKELGPPERWVERTCERYRCAERGIALADVGYGEDGLVTWARIEFVKELAPDSAAVVFWLSGTPRRVRGDAFGEHAGAGAGSTAHYDERGVHLHVTGDVVRAAWMTLPDADLAAIGKQARAARAQLDAAEPKPAAAEPAAEPGAGERPAPPEFGYEPPSSNSPFSPDYNPDAAPVPVPRRRLQVLSTRCEAGELEGEQGYWILARIQADGMKDRDLRGRLQFLLPDGQFFAAPRGTRYRDERGRATITTHDKVRFDQANWSGYRFFVPFSLVQGQADLRALFMLNCAGLTAYAVHQIPLSPRALQGWPGGQLRGITQGLIDITPSVNTNRGPTLQMRVGVDPSFVGNREVLGGVRLRAHPDTQQQRNTRRFLPPAPGPDAKIWNDGNGNLRALNALQRSADGSSTGQLQVLVPYAVVGVGPGRHRLVLELLVSCGNLSTLSEIEVEIEKQ